MKQRFRGFQSLCVCAWLISPSCGWSHGFGERYDLPVPMAWITVAGCLLVLLSFLLTAVVKTQITSRTLLAFNLLPETMAGRHASAAGIWLTGLKALSMVLLILTWSTARFGSADPLMNFSPTFIWIVWWLGCSFAFILTGNYWAQLDPWRNIYMGLHQCWHSCKNRLSPSTQISNPNHYLKWPPFLGRWPACAMLLLWCALEIIYPIAAMPQRIGAFIAIYSVYTWMGMALWGPSQWQAYADGFALYFELIGQTRHMLLSRQNAQLALVPAAEPPNLSTIALVIAIFTSVLFDGIHAGPVWLIFEKWMTQFSWIKADTNAYLQGSMGLIGLWAVLLSAYLATCRVTCFLGTQLKTLEVAHTFLSSLFPIAMAYLIAHNFSSFFIQGQNIIALASDPYGWGWDLFGTSHYYPDISLVDAKLTWYVATVSIVVGHVISVFMSHQVALTYFDHLPNPQRKALRLNLPMTVAMMALTAISLSIIAEPLVS